MTKKVRKDKESKHQSQEAKQFEIRSLKAALRADKQRLNSLRRMFREEHVDTEEETEIMRELDIARKRKEKIANELDGMKAEYEDLKIKHAESRKRRRKRVVFLEV